MYTGDICRSPNAEGVLADTFESAQHNVFTVESGGVGALVGEGIDRGSARMLARRGWSTTGSARGRSASGRSGPVGESSGRSQVDRGPLVSDPLGDRSGALAVAADPVDDDVPGPFRLGAGSWPSRSTCSRTPRVGGGATRGEPGQPRRRRVDSEVMTTPLDMMGAGRFGREPSEPPKI